MMLFIFLLFLFHFSFFLKSQLGLFLVFFFPFIFTALVTHIGFSFLNLKALARKDGGSGNERTYTSGFSCGCSPGASVDVSVS